MPSDAPFADVRFPEGIAFAILAPDEPAGEPLPEERALLSPRALPERVAEFARGRAAARRALAALGVSGAEQLAILRAGPRAPRWPEGIVGAIAHSAGWAAAACARSGQRRGLGIDLERVRPVPAALLRRILRPEERDWEALPEAEHVAAFARAFSAKESIYKALHPATGIFLGYHDASVEWGLTPPAPLSRGRAERNVEEIPTGDGMPFAWTLHKGCGTEFPEGFRGEGRAWAGAGLVLTAVWV
jgi:4'-phosphopantetheinyl transferase EntD